MLADVGWHKFVNSPQSRSIFENQTTGLTGNVNFGSSEKHQDLTKTLHRNKPVHFSIVLEKKQNLYWLPQMQQKETAQTMIASSRNLMSFSGFAKILSMIMHVSIEETNRVEKKQNSILWHSMILQNTVIMEQ